MAIIFISFMIPVRFDARTYARGQESLVSNFERRARETGHHAFFAPKQPKD